MGWKDREVVDNLLPNSNEGIVGLMAFIGVVGGVNPIPEVGLFFGA